MPNTSAFPSMDVEHVAVAPTVGGDSRYKKFDYQEIGKIKEEELESHGVDTEAAQGEADKALYVGPEIISDPLLLLAWPLTDGRMPQTLTFMTMPHSTT